MKRFKIQSEPANWEVRCRTRGMTWLLCHPNYKNRPEDYWSEFEPVLRIAFLELCS